MMEDDTVELLNVTAPASSSYQDQSSEPRNGVTPAPVIPRGKQQDGISCVVAMAACMAALGGILFGYDIGIISGALLQLKPKFKLNCLLSELVVGSMLFGAILASLSGGFLVDHIGRRLTIIINSLVFIVGALILTFSYSVPVLIIGRVIVGFGVSLSAIAECVYISEIAPPRRRGCLVSLNELGITLGFLLAYLVNYSFILVEDGWRYMFGLSILPALIQGVGMFLLPTSPRYLMIKNDENSARKVLEKLRGSPHIDAELDGMRQSLDAEKSSSVLDLFRSKNNMRSRMLIGCGLVFLQQFTGQPNVLYYAPTIFQSVGFHSNTAATLATIGLGAVKVISTVISLLCVDRAGRRTFLITGSVVMTVSILVMALTTLRAHTDPDNSICSDISEFCDSFPNATDCSIIENGGVNKSSSWGGDKFSNGTNEGFEAMTSAERYGALISLLVFVAAYALGFGPVTWLILSEIFPSSVKGRAVSFATVLNWSTNLLVTMTFLNVMGSIGVSSTFFIYAAICALSVTYIFAFVPETKNRSLEQISADLKENSASSKVGLYCSRLCNRRLQTTAHLTVSYHQVDNSEIEGMLS